MGFLEVQGPIGGITCQNFGLSFHAHMCGLDPRLLYSIIDCEEVSLVSIPREST
jgi:hypothetical protein